VTVESSRTPGGAHTFQPAAGCPRCGVRLDSPYKYCPDCSYRLRPDLTRHHLTEAEPISTSQRLLALGGYLGFISLILLLLLAGMRLFEDDPLPAEPVRSSSFSTDQATIRLEDLHEVPGGDVAWGVYRPEATSGALMDLIRTMPESMRPAEENEEVEESADEIWLRNTYGVLEARTRAILPEFFRVDDAFSLGITEVTQAQWFAFLVARAKKSGRPSPASYYPSSWRRASGDPLVPRIYPANSHEHPVTDIDPVRALEFCNWVWEDAFDSDPDLVVDLPTVFEFARAGRVDALDNFPWPSRLIPETVVLEGRLQPTRNKARVGYYHGLYALVGNAAEWIHFGQGVGAAGWSYLDSARRRDADRNEWRTPFSTESVEDDFDLGDRATHVGFRIVVRRAPSMPRFVAVAAGKLNIVARTNPVLPPKVEVQDPDGFPDFRELPPVELPAGQREVTEAFEIATTEITNRQYLRFLAALSEAPDPPSLMELVPGEFTQRAQPFRGREIVFRGPYGRSDLIPTLFPAGRENYPVQSLRPHQAQAYAKWLGERIQADVGLPTVEQFVRAGRADGKSPYPWGDSTGHRGLICDGRGDDLDRAVSVAYLRSVASAPDAIVGLCGNLLELVRAPDGKGGERWLLAGGCYEFEPEACTLDSYLDWTWRKAQIKVDTVFIPFALAVHTGFRVVVRNRQP